MPDSYPEILQNDESSVAVSLKRLPNASLLWAATPRDEDTALDYAVSVAPADSDPHGHLVGWADRYGGMGISHNGGAGRAVSLGDRYLKGVGRTPLLGTEQISQSTDGLLFLEEAIRECILGTILTLEAPWGGVRPSAVIDAGTHSDAVYRSGPKIVDHLTIVVRKSIIRPAHFERAVLYRGRDSWSGVVDEARVDGNIRKLALAMGGSQLAAAYAELWPRWSEQFAYQFINRMSQSLPTSSNVTLDGRLLDFGAARTLPSWNVHVPGPGLTPFGEEFFDVLSFLRRDSCDVFMRILQRNDVSSVIAQVEQQSIKRHSYMTSREFLRLVGFRGITADRWLAIPSNKQKMQSALHGLITRVRSIYSYEVDWPEDEWRWHLPNFWSDNCPRILRELRCLCETVEHGGEPVKQRASMRTRSRPGLNYDRLHADIFHAFGNANQQFTNANKFNVFVAEKISENRRDTKHEPEFAVLHGFAIHKHQSFSLFRRENGSIYAIKEFDSFGEALEYSLPEEVHRLDQSHIEMKGGDYYDLLACDMY